MCKFDAAERKELDRVYAEPRFTGESLKRLRDEANTPPTAPDRHMIEALSQHADLRGPGRLRP